MPMAPTRPPLHASAAILLELSFGLGHEAAIAKRIHDRSGGELTPKGQARALRDLVAAGLASELVGDQRVELVGRGRADLRRYFEITAAGSERVAEIRCCLMKMAGVEPST